MTIKTGTRILQGLLQPRRADLSPEAARSILRLDFPAADHRRVEALSAKASTGNLTDAERSQLDEYLRVANLLAILQSKARLSLQRAAQEP
jgi:hypothetical protein